MPNEEDKISPRKQRWDIAPRIVFVGLMITVVVIVIYFSFSDKFTTKDAKPNNQINFIKMGNDNETVPIVLSDDEGDKYGPYQMLSKQISPIENSMPCIICIQRPCKCPNSNGQPVIKEPGAARDQVFSDPLSSMIYA